MYDVCTALRCIMTYTLLYLYIQLLLDLPLRCYVIASNNSNIQAHCEYECDRIDKYMFSRVFTEMKVRDTPATLSQRYTCLFILRIQTVDISTLV